MTNLEEVVWAQEEPKNNGAWFFVEPFSRNASPPPAARSTRAALCRPRRRRIARDRPVKRHQMEQAALVADALGHNVREEIRRTRKG